MTKELVLLTLAALTEQIEHDEILLESVESTMNDEAGHITLRWLKLPRPATNDAPKASDVFEWKR